MSGMKSEPQMKQDWGLVEWNGDHKWNGIETMSGTECGSLAYFHHLSKRSSQTCSCLLTSEGNTRPGQSHSRMVRVRKMVWKCFVWPGVRDVLTI